MFSDPYLFVFLMSLQAIAKEAMCGNIDNINAVRADHPILKVLADYPELSFKSPRSEHAFRPPRTPGCAVVTFTLSIKPGSKGKLLIPQNVKIYNASETRFGFAAVKAVTQWEYLSKEVPDPSKYFTVFTF